MSRPFAAGSELRLLIVDDDFLFADSLPRLLRKSFSRPPLAIAAARSPADALDLLAAERFDVVLCDFDLKAPQSGLDVLAQAARTNPDAFRILLSGHSPREIPQDPGAAYDAFLDKPMTLRAVVPRLAELLRARLGIEFEPAEA